MWKNAWKMWKMWKNAFWKCTWKKLWKNMFWKCTWKKGKKCETMRKNYENMWKKRLKIQLGRWNSDFFFFRFVFLGSSFAAVTLLPAQLLQVENRRGAVQIDRKWTVQIADLLNLAIVIKQWLPGANHKITKPQNCFQKYIYFHIFSHFSHFWNAFFHISKNCIFETHFFTFFFTCLIQTTTTLL